MQACLSLLMDSLVWHVHASPWAQDNTGPDVHWCVAGPFVVCHEPDMVRTARPEREHFRQTGTVIMGHACKSAGCEWVFRTGEHGSRGTKALKPTATRTHESPARMHPVHPDVACRCTCRKRATPPNMSRDEGKGCMTNSKNT